MAYKTRLGDATRNFSNMMKDGFGIVTVMNVDVFNALDTTQYKNMTAYDVVKWAEDEKVKISDSELLCTIDTLKIANAPQEGPSKTVTGGQFSNPLIKFGKSARLEMQDALGRAEAIEALGGGIVEYKGNTDQITGLHFGEDFVGPKLLVGDSFFIDQQSGKQIKVKVVFYQFLPDSIFNLTQDAEGDATVFDMNGDLLTTVIQVGKDGSSNQAHGVFYSIVDPEEGFASYFTISEQGVITITEGYTATLDGTSVTSGTTKLYSNQAGLLVIEDAESNEVYSGIIRGKGNQA